MQDDRSAAQEARAGAEGAQGSILATTLAGLRGRLLRAQRSLPVVNLALQGGGAHGAFTWGVLDRLLEEPDFRFEGISGTSAGAMNAVVLASGWLSGGPDGARGALATFWRQLADIARPLGQGSLPRLALDVAAQLLSPYQLNPLGINPLRGILERLVHFELLRHAAVPKLFIAATNLRTGRARIFENPDLTVEAVLASAALPQLHRAVEIDGDAYWDGGYVSNPPILALTERCRAVDLLLVQLNPDGAAALPVSAAGIRNRVGEIVFGGPLRNELELLDARRERARAPLARFLPRTRRLARHRRHVIDGSKFLGALDPATKAVPDWRMLLELHHAGRAAADAWLRAQDRRSGASGTTSVSAGTRRSG